MEIINQSITNRIKLEKIKKNDYNNIPLNFSNKTFNNINHKKMLDSVYINNNTSSNRNITKKTNNKNNNGNKYRKELIIAKVIISELQDKIEEINKDKKDLEIQLDKALNTIKFLHSDYISLTDKFDFVNRTLINESNNKEKIYNEVESKLNELKTKNEQLNDEIMAKKEINKLQEDALNKKILLLNKKLEKTEEELENYKKMNINMKKLEINKKEINDENLMLKQDNIKISNKYNDERKKFLKEIEEYKNIIKKLENDNFMISSELKEKKYLLEKEKEQNINNQYTLTFLHLLVAINFKYTKFWLFQPNLERLMDKFFNNTNKDKDKNYELINDKYFYILKEFDDYKMQSLKEKNELMEKYENLKKEKLKLEEKQANTIGDLNKQLKMENMEKNDLLVKREEFEIIKEEKKYILNLLLKITPNPKLISQIIDINREIIQLERKKIAIINNKNNNPKVNMMLPKIDEQITIFKNHLSSLEDELINIDLGSSKSNNDNSISSSVL
jgi:hypothetical protein